MKKQQDKTPVLYAVTLKVSLDRAADFSAALILSKKPHKSFGFDKLKS